MAKSELSVLSVQCLDRRISDRQTLIEEVAAWQDCRNKKHAAADWRFTTADARVKLNAYTQRYELNSGTSYNRRDSGTGSFITVWAHADGTTNGFARMAYRWIGVKTE